MGVSNELKIAQPDLTPGPFPGMEGERFPLSYKERGAGG